MNLDLIEQNDEHVQFKSYSRGILQLTYDVLYWNKAQCICI